MAFLRVRKNWFGDIILNEVSRGRKLNTEWYHIYVVLK